MIGTCSGAHIVNQGVRLTERQQVAGSSYCCALGGGRQHKPDLRSFCSRGQRLAGHQFDRWPVLMEEAPCIVEIVRLHSNAAGLSAGAVRYLKVEIEPDRFFWDRLIIAAHLLSPRLGVAHSRFVILIFARRDYGALGALKRRPSRCVDH